MADDAQERLWCVLKVPPTAGEYWDTSGVRGFKFLFAAMKALVERRQPEHGPDQNTKVSL